MTDKQIIINGVNVSGCPYFTFNKIEPNESICISEQSVMCIKNKDCLYKKWQRKEQECEELKEEKQGLIKDWEEKKNLVYEITCKNEKLKQTLTEIKEIVINIGEQRPPFNWSMTSDNLKQILQKINEVEE